jgi:hypothetical protein
MKFEQRPSTGTIVAGTQLLSAALTATSGQFVGGTLSAPSIAANSALFLNIISVTGDVANLIIKGKYK